jgi:OOP family OmpA-OmpF porin
MPPARSKVTFSADSLFDFDKSTVKPAGRIDLDKFAVELKGVEFDVITVTGHTDRIGTQAYNQKLSERRAEAVNSYLVETAGVAGNKISAKGVNGSDPVTKPGDCKGTKVTQALIACLQPDRRVDIEVTGKR